MRIKKNCLFADISGFKWKEHKCELQIHVEPESSCTSQLSHSEINLFGSTFSLNKNMNPKCFLYNLGSQLKFIGTNQTYSLEVFLLIKFAVTAVKTYVQMTLSGISFRRFICVGRSFLPTPPLLTLLSSLIARARTTRPLLLVISPIPAF